MINEEWRSSNKVTEVESKSINTLLVYLRENPTEMGWRGNNKPNLETEDGRQRVAEKYLFSKRKTISPKTPKTVPDQMVSELLCIYFNYPRERLNEMKREHQDAMAAENMVGILLEEYIDSISKNYGWVHCAGELVKKVDFIKYQDNKWKLLQIKNRDNSENSSSSAIRNGTDIQKWFRTFSKTGKTNWENFPDKQLQGLLSEDNFIKFVKNLYNYSKSKL